MAVKKVTKAEKFGNAVREKVDALARIRRNMAHTTVPDTIEWDEVVDEDNQVDWDRFSVWLGESAERVGNVSGRGALWVSEYVLRGLNALLVDNPLLRKIEESLRDSKIKVSGSGFAKATARIKNAIKRNPAKSSYAMYYAMLLSMMVSVKTGAAQVQSGMDKSLNKQEVKSDADLNAGVVALPELKTL